MEDSAVRVTPVTIQPNVVKELDISGVRSVVVWEMTRHGTSAGEVEMSFGDMGDFMSLSPGDAFYEFEEVRRLRLRHAMGADRTIVLLLSYSPNFRVQNEPRGL